jgi:hypothetical protein
VFLAHLFFVRWRTHPVLSGANLGDDLPSAEFTGRTVGWGLIINGLALLVLAFQYAGISAIAAILFITLGLVSIMDGS